MNIINHVKTFSLEEILNSIPQNKSLYRDSGIWQIRTDDMKEVIFKQKIDQSFTDFIYCYVEFIYQGFDQKDKEDFQFELASNKFSFKSRLINVPTISNHPVSIPNNAFSS